MNNYLGKIGVLKQKKFNGKRSTNIGIGTLQIPAVAIRDINIEIGQSLCIHKNEQNNELVIKKTNNINAHILSDSISINFKEFQIVRFATQACAIATIDYPLTEMSFRKEGSVLIGTIPESLVNLKRHFVRKEKPERADWREEVKGLHGAAYAAVLDGNRYGIPVEPISLHQMLSILFDEGHFFEQINPNLWRLDHGTATKADLFDLAKKYNKNILLVN